ncbi:MAG: hypothetical protein OXQ31_00990 [Spirochaetaceae bacterium]|nr:hypothetical protein [Spirochaetaceae bacterium]MDE0218409.1 hypothetical protein [Spirochaetaceae bacterium]
MKDVVRAEWDPPGEEWPLLFRHFEEVRGTDFKVCVMMMGRLLATIDPETGSCTIDGVYPGSLFAEGASLSEANDNVRADISKILEDVMVSSKNVTDFRAHIEDFMQTTDEVAVASWKKALDRVRSGQEEGAPDLRKYDASDWSDFAVVEDVRETQDHKPLMAIPAPPEASLLAA